MIITEKQALKAFEFLHSTEQDHAQLVSDYDALKKHENALLAHIKIKSSEKQNTAKSDEAYASEEYRVWEDGLKAANYNLTLLENKRKRAYTTIDMWRTDSANERRL